MNPRPGLEHEHPSLLSSRSLLSMLQPGVFEWHVHPPAEHPIYARPLSDGVRSVAEATEETGIRHAIQMVSVPSSLDVVVGLQQEKGVPVVYDCHDCVVSSRLPEAERHEEVVCLADTPDESASYVRQLAGSGQTVGRNQRPAVARSETWRHRAKN